MQRLAPLDDLFAEFGMESMGVFKGPSSYLSFDPHQNKANQGRDQNRRQKRNDRAADNVGLGYAPINSEKPGNQRQFQSDSRRGDFIPRTFKSENRPVNYKQNRSNWDTESLNEATTVQERYNNQRHATGAVGGYNQGNYRRQGTDLQPTAPNRGGGGDNNLRRSVNTINDNQNIHRAQPINRGGGPTNRNGTFRQAAVNQLKKPVPAG
mmetsp:Transcript_338/g.375  ORF Transcript_338/g.375 Transcript_338/m.375 type:complete len:209 (+) Transcript_338:110-736(+)